MPLNQCKVWEKEVKTSWLLAHDEIFWWKIVSEKFRLFTTFRFNYEKEILRNDFSEFTIYCLRIISIMIWRSSKCLQLQLIYG